MVFRPERHRRNQTLWFLKAPFGDTKPVFELGHSSRKPRILCILAFSLLEKKHFSKNPSDLYPSSKEQAIWRKEF